MSVLDLQTLEVAEAQRGGDCSSCSTCCGGGSNLSLLLCGGLL